MTDATCPKLDHRPAAGRPGGGGTRPAGPDGGPAPAPAPVPVAAGCGGSPPEESHAGSLALLASWG
jgi:hypothetical protein